MMSDLAKKSNYSISIKTRKVGVLRRNYKEISRSL